MLTLSRWITVIVICLASLAPVSVGAVSPPAGTDYIVQPGNTLAMIALAHYGDVTMYPSIVWTTNARAAQADGYATITDPWAIEPGDKLWLMPAESVQASLTCTDIANGTYISEWTADGAAPLVNGYYSESIVEGSASKIQVTLFPHMAFGKTADGRPLVGAVLYTNGGGSGTFGELVALTGSRGEVQQIATTPLGDRVQIKGLAIVGDGIVLDVITHGPDDPMCCPTMQKTLTFKLEGDALVEIQDSASSLANTIWQTQSLTDAQGVVTKIDDPSRYTVQFVGDKVYYRADCNTGSGTLSMDGDALTIGMLMSTRMACPEGSLEMPFKQALEQVAGYALTCNTLTLNLADGGAITLTGVDPLVDVVWQWESSVAADGCETTVPDPTLFTLEFDGEGNYGIKADCNRGSGAVTVEGNTMTFGLGIMTQAYCGDDSLDKVLVPALNEVTTYTCDGETLTLTLSDGGSLTFAATE